jgi:hypothetical protein
MQLSNKQLKTISNLDTEIFKYRMFSRRFHSINTLVINNCDRIMVIGIFLQKCLTKHGLRKHLCIKSLVSVIEVTKGRPQIIGEPKKPIE